MVQSLEGLSGPWSGRPHWPTVWWASPARIVGFSGPQWGGPLRPIINGGREMTTGGNALPHILVGLLGPQSHGHLWPTVWRASGIVVNSTRGQPADPFLLGQQSILVGLSAQQSGGPLRPTVKWASLAHSPVGLYGPRSGGPIRPVVLWTSLAHSFF